MAPVVEKVSSPLILGEGPHWDAPSQSLYYVDIEDRKIFKYVPASGVTTSVNLGERIGFVLPVEGSPDTLLASQMKRLVLVSWDGKSDMPQVVENLFEVQKDYTGKEMRINDGKADPAGRVWAGTMESVDENAPFVSTLFCVGEGRKPLVREKGVGLSNGLAWSSDNKTMYYIDSLKKSVDAFDYDIKYGNISNRRVVFDLPANGIGGFPDGMTMDSEGKLWVAVFDGGKVLRINPSDGALLSSVSIPAPKVTSVAFGGPALDELFVTTATTGMTRDMSVRYPDAGCLFRVTGLGVKGHAGQPAKL